MEKNKLKLVIIPTYNEALNIEDIISRLYELNNKFKLNIRILVVDDKSPDKTAQIVRKMSISSDFVNLIIRNSKNGLRDAYIEGFHYAIQNKYEAVIMMDADGSHDPLFIKDLIRQSHRYDLVIGSRYIENGLIKNWNILRRFISRFGNLYSKILLGMDIEDLTGGFNLISLHTLKAVNINSLKSNGFAFQVELKYKITKKGYKHFETPITFVDRKKGKSKFNIWIMLEAILRIPLIRFMK